MESHVPATLEFSNKLSTLVPLALKEPNGMVKNVTPFLLKHVLLDMFTTLTSINASLQLLLAETTPTSMEPPVSACQDSTSSTESARNALKVQFSMVPSVPPQRSFPPTTAVQTRSP